MAGNFRRLVELGFVPLLAKEIANTIDAGTVSATAVRRLTELGMIPREIRELRNQLATPAMRIAKRWTEIGVSPRLARELVTQMGGGTPAPVFSVQPSMSPTSGTAGSTLFTASNGTASNTTTYTRRWLLSGTAIGTGTTVTPATAGSLVLEVTATGPGGSTIATTAASTVAAAVAPGTTPPTLTYTPTIRFHPNTATMTTRANGTVQGYVTSAGNWVVTSHDPTQVPGINEGTVFQHVSLPGGQAQVTGGNAGGGGLISGIGSYRIDASGLTIGSSGSPVSFTVVTEQIISVNDLTGNSDGLQSQDGSGPVPIVDDLGRKALLFRGNVGQLKSWLRNNTYTGIDTHNVAWLIVGRVLNTATGGLNVGDNPVISVGYPGTAEGDVYTNELSRIIARTGSGNLPLTAGQTIHARVTDVNVRKKLFLGMQMQVFGEGRATSDGYNGATNTYTSTLVHNETVNTITRSQVRKKNFTGFCLNAYVVNTGTLPTTSSHAGTMMIIYDVVGYTRGEMGDNTQMPGRMTTAAADLKAGWGIPTIVKSLTLIGDSRIEAEGNFYLTPTGRTIASYLADPAASYAVASNVRVMSFGAGGQGVGFMNVITEVLPSVPNLGVATPLSPGFEIGGGNDYFGFLSGTNDIPSTSVLWPPIAGAAGSNAFIDDVYTGNNGVGYQGSFTAGAVTAGSKAIAISSPTGALRIGSLITSGAPFDTGQSLASLSPNPPSAPTSANLSEYQSVAVTAGITVTTQLDGYVPFVKKLLARGYGGGIWCAEPAATGGSVNAYFHDKVVAGAVADVGAGSGGTYAGKLAVMDPTPIQYNATLPFGANYGSGYNTVYSDFIHYTELGKKIFVTGGSTPANGLGAKARALVGGAS